MEVIQTLIQKVFITRRWTKIRSDDVRKLFFTTVMGKILHFLMDESIEEEQKEKQLQVNLYTVFEKIWKTTFAVRM